LVAFPQAVRTGERRVDNSGIPITWVLLVVSGFGLATVLKLFPESVSSVVLAPFGVVWLPPIGKADAWLVPLAAAGLCVPFFVASVWVERFLGRRMVGVEHLPAIGRWAWWANVVSYGCIVVLLLVWTYRLKHAA